MSTTKDENRAMVAWLETAKTAIEKMEWEIVNVEANKTRAESLRTAQSFGHIAKESLGIVAVTLETLASVAESEAARGNRSK